MDETTGSAGMTEFLKWLTSGSIKLGTDLFYALLILIVGLKVSRWIRDRIVESSFMKRIDPSVASFISNTLLFALRAGVVALAVVELGVPASMFVTVFGSVGVAVSLAMQGSLSNLAGGLMLLIYHPFKVGDYIRVEENEGTVSQISAFYTTIITLDKRSVLLPNGALTNSTLINCSTQSYRLLDIPCAVAYASNANDVRAVLLRVARMDALVLDEPAPIAPMTSLTDNSMIFTLRVAVRGSDYLAVKWGLTESVKLALDEAGITIPFPQLDVHIQPKQEA